MPLSETAEKRKQDRRKALVDLALDMIAEEGLAACSFRNLAAREGRTTRRFTYEFGSMSNLLAAVYMEAWRRLGFTAGEEPAPGDDPLGQLFELCTRAAPIDGLEGPAMRVYTAILCHSIEDPVLRAQLAEADTTGAAGYLNLIRAAQSKGQIPADRDPDDLLAHIWALSDGLIIAAAMHPGHFTPQRLERVWTGGFETLAGASVVG